MRSITGRFLAMTSVACLTFGWVLAKGVIQVRCVDEAGQPIKGVEVIVRQPAGSYVKQNKTNKRGEAEFKNAEQGYYRVIARGDGYDPGLRDVFEFSGEGEMTVDMTLKPGSPDKKLYLEDPSIQQEVNQLIIDGAKLIREREMDAAKEKLNKALEIMPASPDGLIQLGLAQLNSQEWEKADATFQEALDLLEIFQKLGVGDMSQRRQEVLEVKQSIPFQKIAWRSHELMKERRYEDALPVLQEMIEMAPDNPDVYYSQAIALAHSDRTQEAKAAVEKALEINPNDRSYKELLGQIEAILESGRSLEAQETIQGIEKEYQEGNHEAALQQIEQAMQSLDEQYHGPLWLLKAQTHSQREQYDASLAAYAKAVETNPDDALAIKREMARTCFTAEKYEEGLELYHEVFQAEPEGAEQKFFEMAQDFNRRGEAELAARVMEKILEINPDYPEAHFELGVYYFYEKEDKAKARKMFERYLEIGESEDNKDNARAILAVIDRDQ
ncbi:MAG TPA: tetratricopeptide repeat protein [Acidobacteriota bacterium]|nr:tetratricopeptide repeat protein [Acidobacteriota bacterium]